MTFTKRLTTAVILILVVLTAVFATTTEVRQSLFLLVLFLAALEWWYLQRVRFGWLYAIVLVVVASLITQSSATAQTIVSLAAVGWILCPLFLWNIRTASSQAMWLSRPAVHEILGLVILVPGWLAIGMLSPWSVLTLFVTIWVADASAYFVGRAWGRFKLAPNISPGKTWEGFVGGIVFGVGAGCLFGQLSEIFERQISLTIIFCAIIVGVSVVGDLTESFFKRVAGVKDSGRLLPGHGGVLDRIDSLIAAAPVFVVGQQLVMGVS